MDRISSEPVGADELSRARAYTKGRLELRMEDSGAVAGWIGMGEILLPRILTVEEVIERLDAVTIDDLLRVARSFLRPSEARLAVLGPFRSRRRSVWVRTRCVTPSRRRFSSLNRMGRSRSAMTIIDHLSAIWSRIGRLGQSARKTTCVPASMPYGSVSLMFLGSPEVRY